MRIVYPPGGYGDGPVYLRVDRARAAKAWPQPGYTREVNDWRLEMDPMYDYVEVHNSHSAFAYCRLLEAAGVLREALDVVMLKSSSDTSGARTARHPGRGRAGGGHHHRG